VAGVTASKLARHTPARLTQSGARRVKFPRVVK